MKLGLNSKINENDIAVIGMACRLPGAQNYQSFWENLKAGKEALEELSDDELRNAGVSESDLANPNYVKAGMFLRNMECFDAGFFGFSPLDAKIMDPQHRHFLECSWEAFEDAGYNPESIEGAVGVFAGSGYNSYMTSNLLSHPELLEDVGFFLMRHTGNDKDFLSTRLSYCFNLKGPSVNIQTACSTSLVAVHQAIQSLLSGECDMALAGGVTINLPHRQGYLYKENEILSTDGHCRPFDSSSSGTVFGSGVGVVLLKRLEEALEDGDYVHAIIKASAINNDGSDKVSYLAPSVDGQVAVMREALEVADIDAQSVGYIECHGTGTQLGDPIEFAAIRQAYSLGGAGGQPCALGSVKSNIGHLDTAAGVAGLIKVVESLKHQAITPTLHYKNANESIDLDNSLFFVNTEFRDWQSDHPLRAGISSLGVGGTNAHIILERFTGSHTNVEFSAKPQLFLFSARSDQSLIKYTNKLADFCEEKCQQTTEYNLDNIAYTLAVGRKQFDKRCFAIIDNPKNVSNSLDKARERIVDAAGIDRDRKVVLMFAGGGAQYPNMGKGLYQTEPVYRQIVDESIALIAEFVDFDLKALLFPEAGAEEAAAKELNKPSRSLPSLFITQYAQAKLWQSWGVNPSAMIGHSMGENTAACIAGVFSLKDALGLVALRGRLFDTVPQSGMLSVQASEDELSLLLDELDIAAINADGLTVVSGGLEALAKFETRLDEREISYKRIHINIAAHSRMLEGVLKPFGDYLRSIKLNKPEVPFMSNLTGDWISDEQAVDPEYWVSHLRNTVRFADGASKLLQDNRYVMLEVGPGKTLSRLVTANQHSTPQHAILNSLRHPEEEEEEDKTFMLSTLGALWQHGANIDWDAYFKESPRQRVPLPTYCFDHVNYWVEPADVAFVGSADTGELRKGKQLEDWLYQPVWQQIDSVQPFEQNDLFEAKVVLMTDSPKTAEIFCNELKKRRATTIIVGPKEVSQAGCEHYELDWNSPLQVSSVVSRLIAAASPTHILHTLNIDNCSSTLTPDEQCRVSFDSLFLFAQALANEAYEAPLHWLVLSRGSQQVAGEKVESPWQSLSLGPVYVLPRELPNVSMSLLDLQQSTDSHSLDAKAVSIVLPELFIDPDLRSNNPAIVAIRGGAKFSRSMQPLPTLKSSANKTAKLKDNGVYIITGGLGGLGIEAARVLSNSAKVKLVLLSRSSLPERDHWDMLVSQNAPEAPVILAIREIEKSGSVVKTVICDISDADAVRKVKTEVEQALGPVNGIIHTAGIVDDSLVQLKQLNDAHKVLRPKFMGAQAITHVFDVDSLDFVLLYSSTSAFMGLPGQIDYAASNAYLDAIAAAEHGKGNFQVCAINWSAWKDVGMAAIAAKGPVTKLPPGIPIQESLLNRMIQGKQEQNSEHPVYFATSFNVKDYWLLNEHKLAESSCLIPGTGFIEIIRQAYEHLEDESVVCMEKVQFMLPFTVNDSEEKVLYTELQPKPESGAYRASLYGDVDGEKMEYARAEVHKGQLAKQTQDLEALIARCNIGIQLFSDPDHHPYIDFGPRWASLQKVYIGNSEAVIEIELQSEYEDDLQVYGWHPAMMDMATAGAQAIVKDYDPQSEFYVPVGYKRINANKTLPGKMYSYLRYKQPDSELHSHDISIFDIDIYNSSGVLCAHIENFTMQRIADIESMRKSLLNPKNWQVDPALEKTLELGINPKEGSQILEYALSASTIPQIVVSIYPLHNLQKELLSPYEVQGSSNSSKDELPTHDADADPDISEIESELIKHEGIENVIVRSHLDDTGERRLVCHYIIDWDYQITMSEFRKYVKEVLDEDKVPQYFVEHDDFPCHDDGEVDRKSLADPLAPVDNYLAPRTATEKTLAMIWQDILGLDRIGLNDNFFDMGGHSLLSIRAIVKTEKKLGVQLDQGQMVLQTVEQLAAEIDKLRSQSPDVVAPN